MITRTKLLYIPLLGVSMTIFEMMTTLSFVFIVYYDIMFNVVESKLFEIHFRFNEIITKTIKKFYR